MIPGKTTWTTASVYRETSEAVTIVFDTNGRPFDYKPGQFINLKLVIDGEAVSRSYSLSSTPGGDEKPAITVKKIEGGLVSSYIFRHAEEISSWEIEGPFGQFYPGPEITGADHVVLVAAGSGITPVFSILKFLLTSSTGNVTLLYSSKSWKETIFKSVLGYLEQQFAGRLSTHYFFTAEAGSEGFEGANGFPGRINRLMLKKILKKRPGSNNRFFICGPYSFIESVTGFLENLEIPQQFIQKEYFVVPTSTTPAIDLPNEKREVLLHLNEQTNLLEVEPGQTILEAALADKIPVPYSCKQGTCGLCTAQKTAGKVYMKNNFALDEERIAAGLILLCQSHPLDNEVTVEMNAV